MSSTLEAQFKDLQADVGYFLGYGRGPDFDDPDWTSDQQAAITRCVKGGLRNFYFCGTEWSFLRPAATLGLGSGSSHITLPDDFGGADGTIQFSAEDSSQVDELPFCPIGRVYRATAENPDQTGRPELACIEPIKGTTPQSGQRFRIKVYPEADQDYTAVIPQYYLNPDFLTGTKPFAYGGAEHAETLLESCLAVAEKLMDDAATVHALEFEKRLAVSRDLDRRKKPSYLGYNGSRQSVRRNRHQYDRNVAMWGGIEPTG